MDKTLGAGCVGFLVAGASVTVTSPNASVVEGVTQYFAPWWNATAGTRKGPRVTVVEDAEEFGRLEAETARDACGEVEYPRAPLLFARHSDERVTAVSRREGIAYRYVPGESLIEIYGTRPSGRLRSAACRIAREVIRGQLVAAGWSLLHASGVVIPGGSAVLTLGRKGAGKSTVGFTLAASGAGLLGNDRVFARPLAAGGVELVPWPSGATIGVGLLKALGWDAIMRERLESGELAHPSQDERVTAAILAGETSKGLYDGQREVKAHVRAEQFTPWFGVRRVPSGTVAMVVFPRYMPGQDPSTDDAGSVAMRDDDFMMGRQEDAYPDVFGLSGGHGAGTPKARRALVEAVGALPRHAVTLGSDPRLNARFLLGLDMR